MRVQLIGWPHSTNGRTAARRESGDAPRVSCRTTHLPASEIKTRAVPIKKRPLRSDPAHTNSVRLLATGIFTFWRLG